MSQLIEARDVEPVVEAMRDIRRHYPTPLGEEHGQLLIDLAYGVRAAARDLPDDHPHRTKLLRAGLLKKDGGTRIELPRGETVSQDCIAFPTGHAEHYDVMQDAEDRAKIQWGEGFDYLPDDDRYLDIDSFTPRIVLGDKPKPKEPKPPSPEPKPEPTKPAPAPAGPSYDDVLKTGREIEAAYEEGPGHAEIYGELFAHLLWRYMREGFTREQVVAAARERGKGEGG